ncbi:uncharacterized protein [Rutidosis leptorrhynchoides]|uniref:uncharacterized protein n=1 Tax=Rutidosis leptorrhynchoides TaxID=125765 RepID=UPI003A98CFA4
MDRKFRLAVQPGSTLAVSKAADLECVFSLEEIFNAIRDCGGSKAPGPDGFGDRWIKWINACLSSATLSVLINGSPTKEFKIQKGVRQGDPLAPYLFLLAAECLNMLTKTVVRNNSFEGIRVGSKKVLLSQLQYADDTMFFGDWSRKNARSLMKILKCFKSTSGLKINFNKSCVYGIGISKIDVSNMVSWLGCVAGSLPITYLGLPLGANMKLSLSWDTVFEKFTKRLADWKARAMSYGRRLTLIKSSTLSWSDTWVGNGAQKDRFNRFYRLESNKSALIYERISWVSNVPIFSWCWSRKISGRLHGDIANITNEVSSVVSFAGDRDRWRWDLDSNGELKVIKLTKIITRAACTNSIGHHTLINKLVQIKIGIIVWRARRKKIPTRVELDKHGLDLGTIRCPICDDDIESIDNALFHCKVAKEVWHRVFNWWSIPFPSTLDASNAFQGKFLATSSHDVESYWQAVEWVTGYMIWKNRNSATFSNKVATPAAIVNEIQLLSFEWIRNRSKREKYEWHIWLSNPLILNGMTHDRSGIG